jgi:hypothetical protein
MLPSRRHTLGALEVRPHVLRIRERHLASLSDPFWRIACSRGDERLLRNKKSEHRGLVRGDSSRIVLRNVAPFDDLWGQRKVFFAPER